MKVTEAFPSKYLKASDLPDEEMRSYTIESVHIEEIGAKKEKKPVLYFLNEDKGFVCNKTNANIIARVLGSDEMEDWIGKSVSLYRAEVEFQGDMVEAIRVRLRTKSQGTPRPTQETEEPF